MGEPGHTFHDLVSGARRGPVPALLRRLLWLARLPYGAGVRVRNKLYDRGRLRAHRPGVPVVSVGNLTLGGTGKTPCVEWIAAFLRGHDLRVAILSRGYGAGAGRNDEAMVLEENLPDVPHLQGADRVELARVAVEELESEVLILDDGFQHRRLARDLDVVLIDSTNPWGYGYLFPRGLLREPVSSLRRAGIVVLTRCEHLSEDAARAIRSRVARYAPGVPVVTTVHEPLGLIAGEDGRAEGLEAIRGRPVAAFAGIGNPDAFRRTLTDLGAPPLAFRAYPDHHPYGRDDVAELHRWAEALPAGAVVLTTQKDWVKLRLETLGDRPLRALRVGLRFLDGRELFERRLLEAVRGPEGPPQG
ncbi:MAG TPA: tetraacyldisaccharide 4'-kinase [Gemmataceae bacterium]